MEIKRYLYYKGELENDLVLWIHLGLSIPSTTIECIYPKLASCMGINNQHTKKEEKVCMLIDDIRKEREGSAHLLRLHFFTQIP